MQIHQDVPLTNQFVSRDYVSYGINYRFINIYTHWDSFLSLLIKAQICNQVAKGQPESFQIAHVCSISLHIAVWVAKMRFLCCFASSNAGYAIIIILLSSLFIRWYADGSLGQNSVLSIGESFSDGRSHFYCKKPLMGLAEQVFYPK